jgi:acyl-CoA synthetase (NDP forming)
MPATHEQLKPLFYPRSVAVLGASSHPLKFGFQYLRALQDFGFPGRLYPVNPELKEVLGLKVYPSVAALPEPVDLATVSVPAPAVPAALRECLARGIPGAQVLSAGFREAGPEGRRLEAELADLARQGIRVIGPNCFGVYSPAAGITLMPGSEFSRESGPVGFFSQSGGGSCDLAYMARGRGLRFSVLVSYGNGCDLETVDLLDYFRADPETKVVGAYLEGVRDGRAFFAALKRCAAEKPVVIYKGGLTETGRAGARSHTGSLAGEAPTWKAALRQAGAIAAESLPDLVECLMACVCLGDFTGAGLGILAGGGARNVEALDAAGHAGFRVPAISSGTEAAIAAKIPPAGGRAGNPTDLANPVMAPSVIGPVMEALAGEPAIDALLLYQAVFYLHKEVRRYRAKSPAGPALKLDYHLELAEAAERIRRKTGKPLLMILPDVASDPAHAEMEEARRVARRHYTSRGIPCFDHAEAALSVLKRLRARNLRAGDRS